MLGEKYDSAFDAACCGGPTLHRWTPHPAMEECVVCQSRQREWPGVFRPCYIAKQLANFEDAKGVFEEVGEP